MSSPVEVPKRLEMLYHKVTDQAALERMEYVRENYYSLYEMIMLNIPDGRPRSLAITHLEDSLMRSIQALALAHGEPQEMRGRYVHDRRRNSDLA